MRVDQERGYLRLQTVHLIEGITVVAPLVTRNVALRIHHEDVVREPPLRIERSAINGRLQGLQLTPRTRQILRPTLLGQRRPFAITRT